MEVWTAWLIFAGGCFLLEILTEGFLVFWLGVGGLCSMALSFLFPHAYFAQVLTLVIVSIVLILSTRKLTNKFQKKDETPRNVYTILGKKALVSETIDNLKGKGRIKIDGDMWSARNEDDDEIIEKGSTVEIIRIDGVKAMVRKI